jgi:hypothetical protein
MSEPKFTAGPWTYTGLYVEDENGTVIAQSNRGAANAHLIAAAPDLYEALKAVYLELDGRYDGAPDSRVLWMGEHITRISAALAKAAPHE